MILKRFAPLIVLVLLFSSCAEKFDGYKIDGHIEGMANENVYLEFLSPTAATVIDTASVDENGKFVMKGKVIEKGFHRIRNEQSDKFWILLVEDKAFGFKADYTDPKLRDVSITNYPEGEALQKSIDFFMTQQEEVQAKAMELQQTTMNPATELNARAAAQEELAGLEVAMSEKFKAKINELKENNSFSVIYLISALNPQTEGEFLKATISDLETELPNSAYVANLKESIAKMEAQIKQQEAAAAKASQVTESKEAQEIVMKNVAGKDMKLSDLKGKIVLVDFWASWCKPCRAENPNVVRMYHQYKNKGFDIFSVSLDKNQAKWEQAIAKDGLVWKNHVSDLKGWQNAAAQAWGVSSIPATYLLDKDGIIIGQNLRGAALEAKLKEVL